MPKVRVVSLRQLGELLRLMEGNRDIANGRIVGGALAHQRITRFWCDVAVTLNCLAGGVQKTGQQWKAYWHDLKYRAKKRAASVRAHAGGTGGGPSAKPLTDIEQRILAIMGPVAYQGNPSVEIPFHVEEVQNNEEQAQDPLGAPPEPPAVIVPLPEPPAAIVPPTEPPAAIVPPTEPPAVIVPPPAAPSAEPVPDIEVVEMMEEELEDEPEQRNSARGNSARVVRQAGPIRRPRYRMSTDPPRWAQDYEERRLAIDSQRARAQERIANALEAIIPLLAQFQRHE